MAKKNKSGDLDLRQKGLKAVQGIKSQIASLNGQILQSEKDMGAAADYRWYHQCSKCSVRGSKR